MHRVQSKALITTEFSSIIHINKFKIKFAYKLKKPNRLCFFKYLTVYIFKLFLSGIFQGNIDKMSVTGKIHFTPTTE